MPRGYVLDAAGIQKLRDDHEQLKRMVQSLSQKITATSGSGVRRAAEFVKVSTKIGQRVTTKLGTGKAELYKLSKDANTGDVSYDKILDDNGNPIEVDVYNSSMIPVPKETYLNITRDFRSGLWMNAEMQTAVAKAGASGVTARSGTTAGYGDVSVYYVKSGVLEDTGETVRAYSMSRTAVAANAYITIKRCGNLDDWIVDAEDCP